MTVTVDQLHDTLDRAARRTRGQPDAITQAATRAGLTVTATNITTIARTGGWTRRNGGHYRPPTIRTIELWSSDQHIAVTERTTGTHPTGRVIAAMTRDPNAVYHLDDYAFSVRHRHLGHLGHPLHNEHGLAYISLGDISSKGWYLCGLRVATVDHQNIVGAGIDHTTLNAIYHTRFVNLASHYQIGQQLTIEVGKLAPAIVEPDDRMRETIRAGRLYQAGSRDTSVNYHVAAALNDAEMRTACELAAHIGDPDQLIRAARLIHTGTRP